MKQKELEKFSSILKVLGHPVRLRIVCGLLKHPCHVNEMVEGLGLPQSTVSQHLGILRNQGIIAPSKSGVKTCYLVTNKKVEKIIGLLQSQD